MSERVVGVVEAVEEHGDEVGALGARTARVKAVGSGASFGDQTWGMAGGCYVERIAMMIPTSAGLAPMPSAYSGTITAVSGTRPRARNPDAK